MNVFSVVIGLLVTIAVVLFALARIVGNRAQLAQVRSDPAYIAEVQQNIRPFARVAVAGQDNSALKIQAPVALGSAPDAAGAEPAAAAAPAAPLDGAAVYATTCKACHEAGLAGAPKTGDKAVWAPRIAQGKATLYQHAIKGFTGKTGVMLPKGGRTDLSDDLIKQTVDHMVALSQ
ncbi:MAG: cytochrome c5 family protein [Gammaproteobacteria bacterium]|nr:cytochrome c5 family protein [Gammaproteobacteria bacterium]